MTTDFIVHDINKKERTFKPSEITELMLERKQRISYDEIIIDYYLNSSRNESIQISKNVFEKLKAELKLDENPNLFEDYEIEDNKIGKISTKTVSFELKKYKFFSNDPIDFVYEIILKFDKEGKLLVPSINKRISLDLFTEFKNKIPKYRDKE